nr:acyltransferase family protein [Bacillus paramycoides]
MKERLYYLDRLRTVLTILVILHHTSITYGASGSWYYIEVTGDELTLSRMILSLFTGVNQAFFMGFFFLISGFFTPGAYDRKGAANFLRDRFIRLGVPLVFYLAVIGPCLTYWLSFSDKTSLWSFYVEYIFTLKQLDFGPLWFVEALLYFALVYAGYRWFKKDSNNKSALKKFPSHTQILLSAVAVGLTAFAIRLVYPTGTNVLGLQLGYFASYVFLFIIGIYANRNQLLEQISTRTAERWLWVMCAVSPVLPIAAIVFGGSINGGFHAEAFVYAMWEPFIAFGIIMWLIVWFRERFNRANRLFQWLSNIAFTVYIIHPPIVVGICLLMKELEWPPLVKFPIAGIIATVCCFAAASFIRLIPGTKRVLG